MGFISLYYAIYTYYGSRPPASDKACSLTLLLWNPSLFLALTILVQDGAHRVEDPRRSWRPKELLVILFLPRISVVEWNRVSCVFWQPGTSHQSFIYL